MKALLIVGGGIETVPGIKRAKDMGLHVVVSDQNPNAPGFELADDSIQADTYNIQDTVSTALEYEKEVRPIDGVICIAADVPLTVANVAKALSLPGIPMESARLSSDKLAMKHCLSSHEIDIPWFKRIDSLRQLNEVVEERGFPLVLKPTDSRGARGVLRLTEDVDLNWAYQHSLAFSPSGCILLEEYLEGPQFSTEAVILDAVGYPIAFSDRNYEFVDRFAPFIIENGGGFPSFLDADAQELVAQTAIKAGLAMGITNGIVKGDMVLTEQGPKVIEIALRLSGGWLSTNQIPIGTGVDLVGSAIKIALGEDINVSELSPKYHKGVAVRYFLPEPGRIIRIRNVENFQKRKWVHKLKIFEGAGGIVEPVTNHTKRAGFVITTGSTHGEAVERALEVVNGVKIDTVPL